MPAFPDRQVEVVATVRASAATTRKLADNAGANLALRVEVEPAVLEETMSAAASDSVYQAGTCTQ
jgi:hypothetical protein